MGSPIQCWAIVDRSHNPSVWALFWEHRSHATVVRFRVTSVNDWRTDAHRADEMAAGGVRGRTRMGSGQTRGRNGGSWQCTQILSHFSWPDMPPEAFWTHQLTSWHTEGQRGLTGGKFVYLSWAIWSPSPTIIYNMHSVGPKGSLKTGLLLPY